MKIYIETLGCPKNANDSEMAAGILEHAGHVIVSSPEEADGIMVNTCAFINDAKTESIERIFDMASYKTEGKILIVSGCLSQRYPDALYEEMPEADLFLGVNDYEQLPDILAQYEEGQRKKYCGRAPAVFKEVPFRKMENTPFTATVKIAEGCDNSCAYCVIPQIRGKYRSRSQEAVLHEAEHLAEAGCKELILIAQDVTAYGKDLYGDFVLPDLLKKLCRIEGISWIRLMYCYEDRITDELIQVMAEEEKICNYIDIPIQHCSNSVLQAMNRRSTHESILATIEKLKTAMPDIHIRTTLITGFPGETEEDFDELVEFVEEVEFQRLGVFTYSREEGTAAAEFEKQIDEETKKQRQEAIMLRQQEISLKSNRSKIGQVLEVLVEGQEEDGSYIGRSRYDAPEIDNGVLFTSHQQRKPGELVHVLVQDGYDYDLVGVEV